MGNLQIQRQQYGVMRVYKTPVENAWTSGLIPCANAPLFCLSSPKISWPYFSDNISDFLILLPQTPLRNLSVSMKTFLKFPGKFQVYFTPLQIGIGDARILSRVTHLRCRDSLKLGSIQVQGFILIILDDLEQDFSCAFDRAVPAYLGDHVLNLSHQLFSKGLQPGERLQSFHLPINLKTYGTFTATLPVDSYASSESDEETTRSTKPSTKFEARVHR